MAAKTSPQPGSRPYRLGIDLGSGSIGCAAVAEADGGPSGVLAMGVRRFEAGVLGDIEQGKDESRATARRHARGAPRHLFDPTRRAQASRRLRVGHAPKAALRVRQRVTSFPKTAERRR